MNKLRISFYTGMYSICSKLQNWSKNKMESTMSTIIRSQVGTTLIDRAMYVSKKDSELTTDQLRIRQGLRDLQHEPNVGSTELPEELKIALTTINYTSDNK